MLIAALEVLAMLAAVTTGAGVTNAHTATATSAAQTIAIKQRVSPVCRAFHKMCKLKNVFLYRKLN